MGRRERDCPRCMCHGPKFDASGAEKGDLEANLPFAACKPHRGVMEDKAAGQMCA
jgi:hypothetical protein